MEVDTSCNSDAAVEDENVDMDFGNRVAGGEEAVNACDVEVQGPEDNVQNDYSQRLVGSQACTADASRSWEDIGHAEDTEAALAALGLSYLIHQTYNSFVIEHI